MENDNKYKKNKTILRLFPYLKDITKRSYLKIDQDSLHYISIREYAEKISFLIFNQLIKINIDPDEALITDATGGVGGNTISFATMFKYITSIEIDELRCNYLKNNVDVYGFDNVDIINDDCMNIIYNIEKQNVVFLDPPWGGKNYKSHNKLLLKIGDIPLETICNNLLDKDFTKYSPELIVIKLPNNYDTEHIYNTVNSKKIYQCNLDKMIVIIIINNNTTEIVID